MRDRKQYLKEYREKNREKKAEYNREYCLANKEKNAKRNREYGRANRDKIAKRKRERRRADPEYRLEGNLRSRLGAAIRHGHGRKCESSLELTGCTWAELRSHLESQFTDGMTWENYGKWHVDHIRPCASFDLTVDKEQKICFNYSNLQPLWAEDNLTKSDKL